MTSQDDIDTLWELYNAAEARIKKLEDNTTDSITVTREQVETLVLEYIDSLAPTFAFTEQSTSEPIRTTIVARQLMQYLFNNVKVGEEGETA